MQNTGFVNGDGDTTDDGERSTVAGANNLSNVVFAINNNTITVTLTSQKFQGDDKTHPITATVSTDIYLQN